MAGLSSMKIFGQSEIQLERSLVWVGFMSRRGGYSGSSVVLFLFGFLLLLAFNSDMLKNEILQRRTSPNRITHERRDFMLEIVYSPVFRLDGVLNRAQLCRWFQVGQMFLYLG